MGKDYIINQS